MRSVQGNGGLLLVVQPTRREPGAGTEQPDAALRHLLCALDHVRDAIDAIDAAGEGPKARRLEPLLGRIAAQIDIYQRERLS